MRGQGKIVDWFVRMGRVGNRGETVFDRKRGRTVGIVNEAAGQLKSRDTERGQRKAEISPSPIPSILPGVERPNTGQTHNCQLTRGPW
jgi:hypothetical protein